MHFSKLLPMSNSHLLWSLHFIFENVAFRTYHLSQWKWPLCFDFSWKISLFNTFVYFIYNCAFQKLDLETCEIQSFYLEGQSNMHFQLGLAWISRQQSYWHGKRLKSFQRMKELKLLVVFFFNSSFHFNLLNFFHFFFYI